MTRELKLALIVGVTLVLGVAVLISDHLASKRRPRLDTEIALQPAMTPLPAAVPQVAEAAPPPPVAAAPEETTPPVKELAMRTPGVSGKGPEVGEPREVEPPARQVGPAPMIVRQTSAYNDGFNETLPPAPKTHTVAEGDSAYKIAKKYLGDGSQWKKIVDANPKSIGPEGQLKLGTTLVIPMAEAPRTAPLPVREPPVLAKGAKPDAKKTEPAPKTELAKADAAKAAKGKTAKSYTVKPGDTLSGIARRELGSPARADEIAELNKSLIKDPDSLPLGAAIRLPSG